MIIIVNNGCALRQVPTNMESGGPWVDRLRHFWNTVVVFPNVRPNNYISVVFILYYIVPLEFRLHERAPDYYSNKLIYYLNSIK